MTLFMRRRRMDVMRAMLDMTWVNHEPRTTNHAPRQWSTHTRGTSSHDQEKTRHLKGREYQRRWMMMRGRSGEAARGRAVYRVSCGRMALIRTL